MADDLNLWSGVDDSALLNGDVAPRLRAEGQRWDERMTSRLRALLHAGPLLKLKRGESYLDEDSTHYDLLALGLAVLDLVIENTGLDGEVDGRGVEEYLRPLLQEMDRWADVEPDPARHAQVARKVLGALRNDDDRRRPFTIEYTAFDDDGSARVHRLHFRLLEDRHHPDGRVVLAVSPGAANLFLRALDLDIEDSQVANTAILRSQLERGRFQKAVRAAEESRLLSIRYRAKIERLIRETRRNIRQVDWDRDIDELLRNAQEHILRQINDERAIAASAHGRLEELVTGADAAIPLARVLDLIEECTERHTELHRPLINARGVFLEEQERQSFLPPGSGARPNMEEQVLAPLLKMPFPIAAQVLEDTIGYMVYPVPPLAFNLTEMIEWQLKPRREAEPSTQEVVERELVLAGQDLPVYPEEVRKAAGRYLDGISAPTTLGRLLEAAERYEQDPRVPECLVLMSLRLYGPEAIDTVGLCAVRAEREFATARFAGDDLVLIPTESL